MHFSCCCYYGFGISVGGGYESRPVRGLVRRKTATGWEAEGAGTLGAVNAAIVAHVFAGGAPLRLPLQLVFPTLEVDAE